MQIMLQVLIRIIEIIRKSLLGVFLKMDYIQTRSKPAQFLSLTSLKVCEFDYLLSHFAPLCEKYFRYYTLSGQLRAFPKDKEHGNAKLQQPAPKLFFLLTYLKTNPLQEQHAACFGVSQSKVSQLIKTLTFILNQTMESMELCPIRDGERLQKALSEHPNKVFYYDGTERDVVRNIDRAVQQEDFSGKHHRHKTKNLTLCDQFQYVHYLSPSCKGSQHDKSIADEYPILLPIHSILQQDLGFLGHRPEGVTIEEPFKKPKNKELTFSQKLYNQILASTRVVVEHANSGIKRLKIVKDKIRLHTQEVRDQIMQLACAMHNFRVKSPLRGYQYQQKLPINNFS